MNKIQYHLKMYPFVEIAIKINLTKIIVSQLWQTSERISKNILCEVFELTTRSMERK